VRAGASQSRRRLYLHTHVAEDRVELAVESHYTLLIQHAGSCLTASARPVNVYSVQSLQRPAAAARRL